MKTFTKIKKKMCNPIMILILFCIMTLLGCSKDKIGIIIAGSTSVQPYAEILAEEYALLNSDHEIDVQGGGTAAGITASQSGTADIGMSSRNLKEKELDNGLWWIEIARDGLAVIVHPDNLIKNLTFEQLRDIYSGKILNWNEVGGQDAKIHLIAREEGSGTRSAFEDLVMGNQRITPKAIVQNSNGSVKQLVTNDQYAIGFISLGLVNNQVIALKLNGVAATHENIVNGSYELYRPYLFITKSEPTGTTKQFIEYVQSNEGQQILTKKGLIPIEKGIKP